MLTLPKPGCVRIVPLGGLGEIGANCLAIEQRDGILVVDCGISFPTDDIGLELWHPDFRWLRENASRVSGIFVTHGHEDHIGALPYLLEELDVPVWGPPHALELLQRRLVEREVESESVRLISAAAGMRHEVGPFQVEPIRVSHSITEASALAIESAAGTLVHTGDFNFDAEPPDGEPTDVARLAELGECGVGLLLSDSTNVDVEHRRGSEIEVAAALERVVRESHGRVIVGVFASNIQRLIMLGRMARRHGRRICLLGRSLTTQVDVATRIGRLAWPSDLLVGAERVRDLPPDETLVLAGGTQAEPNSALRRLASGTSRWLEIGDGDTVVLSSRIIPGNERAVFTMLCDLQRLGAKVITRHTQPDVHTSGHAGRSEQQRMIELLVPEAFLPIHGTLHHLRRHQQLAKELGVRSSLVIENGTVAEFDGTSLSAAGTVPHGKVAIAWGGERIDDDALRDRHDLARFGVAVVSVVFDAHGELAAPPSVSARGVASLDGDDVAIRSVQREVALTLQRPRSRFGNGIADDIRRAARRQFLELCGCRPVVEVHVIRL